jgi:hypothetical protein
VPVHRLCNDVLVQRERLKSKAVISAGYDPATLELELEFRSGHLYRYENVPASVYAWLLRIENKGGFVRRMIAGRYAERAVAPSERGASASQSKPESLEDTPSLEDTLRASLDRLLDPPA